MDHSTRPKPKSWLLGIILAATCGLAFIPVIFYGCQGEADRWAAAQLMERYLDGDYAQAIQGMEELVRQNPNQDRLKLTLAQWYLNDPQNDNGPIEQALKIVLPIYLKRPDSPSAGQLYQSCLLALGRQSQALEVYKQAHRYDARQNSMAHKNTLSYLRALAREEIDLALGDIEFVTAELEKQWNSAFALRLTARRQSAFCAARIYLFLYENTDPNDMAQRKELFDKAMKLLDRQITELSARYVEMVNLTKRGTSLLMAGQFPLQGASEKQLLGMRGQIDQTGHELAVFLTVRALMLQRHHDAQSPGQSEEDAAARANAEQRADKIDRNLADSFRDRLRTEQLGFDSETIVSQFPTVDQCSSHLQVLAPVLDTSGCVHFAANQLAAALADLNAAVDGQQALWDGGSQLPIANLESTTDARQRRESFEREPQKILAVLLYHRSWVYRGLGRDQAANQDTARIRELGFVPGDRLF